MHAPIFSIECLKEKIDDSLEVAFTTTVGGSPHIMVFRAVCNRLLKNDKINEL